MKWNKYSLKTTVEAEDLISLMLQDIGIEGVEIEDNVPLTESDLDRMFVDIMPKLPADDGAATINFYLETDEDQGGILSKVLEGLDDLRGRGVHVGEGRITATVTEDRDWINNWKEYFHQFRVDDILIKPSWETLRPENEGGILVQIDPGTAFGTGLHETTQLCIRAIRKFLTADTELLDVGTGSGILSIVSLKLGAKHCVGTDLDPCSEAAVSENIEANGIDPSSFEMILGNIIDDREIQDRVGYDRYDIVAANILAETLVPLTPVMMNHLKPGGIYITSGIIDDKEETVKKAIENCGMTVLEVNHQGEWVGITAVKKV